MLRKYRDRYRPALAEAQGSTLLFPGRNGGHKHHVTLSQQLRFLVRKRTGIILNPHLYRHIAAYIYLRAHPGDFETFRQLLGHTSIDTTGASMRTSIVSSRRRSTSQCSKESGE